MTIQNVKCYDGEDTENRHLNQGENLEGLRESSNLNLEGGVSEVYWGWGWG